MFQRAVCRAVVRSPSVPSSSISTSAANTLLRSASSLSRSAPASFVRPASFRSFSSSIPASTSTSSLHSCLSHHTSRHSIHQLFRHGTRWFAAQAVKVPSMGDSITEGTVVQWSKNVGEAVAADEVLVVIETDKVSVDIRAPIAGVLTGQKAVKGQVIKVGDEIAVVDTDAKPTVSSAPAAPKPAPVAASSAPQPAAPAAPTKAAAAASTPPAAPKPAASPVSSPVLSSGSRTSRREPLTRMRQTIAKRLKGAQNVAAMLTTFNEIDMTNIMELRNKYKDEFLATHGVKFGFMSAFVKASTAALIKNPFVNAYMEEDALVFHDYVDVSVAVATPTGLVVPVIRNTDKMNFAQVEKALGDYAAKARKGQIALEDMVGGTFTISNGGVYGSLMGTPILNPPQSAILGMHGIFKRPVVVNDKVEVRQMMYVALTYDHRVIDGAGAVTFLKDIKAYIEDPQRLLLSL